MPLFRFPFKRTDSREQKPQGRRGKPPSGADFSTSPSLLQGELHILTKPQLALRPFRFPSQGTETLLEKGRM